MSLATEHLLANREMLNLERARHYLGSRQRVRTPFGAVEYLEMRKEPDGLWWKPQEGDLVFERDDRLKNRASAYDERLKVVLDCMEIYRNAFPKEYSQSTAPAFSLQREHELYQLIHAQLFPLVRADELQRLSADDLSIFLESHPDFYLPYIPLRGSQEHIWYEGRFDFRQIEIEHQIAFALSWQWQMAPGEAWSMMKKLYELDCPEPLQATGEIAAGAVGWSLFSYSCRVEDPPLQWLPLAFQAISYKTGNAWLDMPQVGAMGVEWSLRQVFELHIKYAQAEDMKLALKALGLWLEENPRERIARCVEIWNDAVRKEQQSGFAGALRDDETGDWL